MRKLNLLLPILLILIPAISFAAPKKSLDPKWIGYDARSVMVIDHSLWQGFLDKYLVRAKDSNQTLMNYAAVTSIDKNMLDSYISTLTALDPLTLNRLEQQAYWINLYNALTVQLILDNYPVSSITKIRERFFQFGPWNNEVTTINGHSVTLNDIEHRILRPIYNDPRIHYAVNCAALGCPNLLSTAFTSANVDELLEEGAIAFTEHERGVRIEGNKMVLSSIYDWYEIDFGGSVENVVLHLSEYLQEPKKSQVVNFKGKVEYEYDWSLNEVKAQ